MHSLSAITSQLENAQRDPTDHIWSRTSTFRRTETWSFGLQESGILTLMTVSKWSFDRQLTAVNSTHMFWNFSSHHWLIPRGIHPTHLVNWSTITSTIPCTRSMGILPGNQLSNGTSPASQLTCLTLWNKQFHIMAKTIPGILLFNLFPITCYNLMTWRWQAMIMRNSLL
jgi:hypothetical protein